jgi:hypothetical protein
MRFFLFALFFLASCSSPDYTRQLPDASLLGTIRGFSYARVITHLHSPYSWDACDKKGVVNGVVNASCLSHLRLAMCENHIDFAFLTDHPANMAFYDFSDLLMVQPGDQTTSSNGIAYLNQLSGCSDGFLPQWTVGFEDTVTMVLAMRGHLSAPSSIDLQNLYQSGTSSLRNQLQAAGGLLVIPHTERWTDEDIENYNPVALEIHNIHAMTDPKIRLIDLHLPPFEHLPAMLSYLIDPYRRLNPDFSFLGIMDYPSIYFQKWNTYIQNNSKNITGLTGNDAHENVLAQIVSDGERFDSFRRMTRFISNFFFTQDRTLGSITTSLQSSRSFLVVEGLGTPMGMDFNAEVSGTTVNVGDRVSLNGGQATFQVALPAIFGNLKGAPQIRIELKQVMKQGQDQVVASAANQSLTYSTVLPGAYRAHLYIVPTHLRDFVQPFSHFATNEYLWIVSNHILLTP